MRGELPEVVEDFDGLVNEICTLSDDMREMTDELAERHGDVAGEMAECGKSLSSIADRVTRIARTVESRECGTEGA